MEHTKHWGCQQAPKPARLANTAMSPPPICFPHCQMTDTVTLTKIVRWMGISKGLCHIWAFLMVDLVTGLIYGVTLR